MTTSAIQLIAVAGGGALGALTRYGLGLWFASAWPGRLNIATLMVNVLGSLLIGIAYVVIVEKLRLPPVYRQLLMVGFLGGFTTFSAFSLEALTLVQSGQMVWALSYVGASVVLSLAAVTAGYYLAQTFS